MESEQPAGATIAGIATVDAGSDRMPPAIGADRAAAHRLPRPAQAWWTVAVLTLLYALSLMDRQVIALVVNDIRRDLGITDFAVGLLNGLAFAFFYVSFGFVFGVASDRHSRRGLIAIGLTVWSIATACCGLARSMPQLLIARFAVGAGEGSLNPSAYSLIADSFPRERLSLATSVFGAGSHFGAALSLLVGGLILEAIPASGLTVPLLGTLAPWRAVFLLLGLPGLLIVLLVYTMADPGRRGVAQGQRTGAGTGLRALRAQGRFLVCHNLGFALMMAGSYAFAAWTPTFLIRNLHVPVSTIGMTMAALTIGIGMPAAIAAGYVADRLTARGMHDAPLRMFMILAWVQLAGLVGIACSTTFTGFLCAAAVFIAASSFPGVAAAALQVMAPPAARGQATAVYMAATGLLGPGIGPVLVGTFTSFIFANDARVGWSIAAVGMLLLPLASLCLFLAARPMRERLAAEKLAQ